MIRGERYESQGATRPLRSLGGAGVVLFRKENHPCKGGTPLGGGGQDSHESEVRN
nr:MAG TPA: hypothetical protein [Caudoviricetes sp.]